MRLKAFLRENWKYALDRALFVLAFAFILWKINGIERDVRWQTAPDNAGIRKIQQSLDELAEEVAWAKYFSCVAEYNSNAGYRGQLSCKSPTTYIPPDLEGVNGWPGSPNYPK